MANFFRHIGVVVQDVEAAVEFWLKTFNFKLILDSEEPSPYIDTLLDIEKPNLRTIKLQDQNGFILELLQFRSYPDEKLSSQELISTGLTHIAITIDDVESIYKRLINDGFTPVSEILIPPNGKVKVVFFRGPENLFLELVEVI